MKEPPSIGCAILTYKGKHHLPRCLPPLVNSPLKPRVLVIDSSSNDGTIELAKDLGAEAIEIPQKEFNHGTTRELARKLLNTDIVCMLTQDAYMIDHHTLKHLINPIIENQSKIAYARQIPHPGASFFESFPRQYNYPSTNHLRGINDRHQYGAYTFFCSDSCAAYCNAALNEIGGFEEVLLGEDTVATAKILRKGHKIAYCAEAIAYHSHNYTLKEEFQRSFDTGIARKGYASIIDTGSSDASRGKKYAKEMLSQLIKNSPWLLPYGVAHIVVKWTGYKMGTLSLNAPTWFKKKLSSQKYYWK